MILSVTANSVTNVLLQDTREIRKGNNNSLHRVGLSYWEHSLRGKEGGEPEREGEEALRHSFRERGIIWQSVLPQSFLSGAATGVIQRAKVLQGGRVNLRGTPKDGRKFQPPKISKMFCQFNYHMPNY